MKQLITMTASELSALLQAKEISSLELTNAYLQQIETRDAEICAYLTVTHEHARKTARFIDECRAKGETLPPLAGVPMALKDNICTKDIRTTCASALMSEFVPPYDATVYHRLLQNGAVLLGKLNMDEFGMGSSTKHSAFCVTRNPHDTRYVSGGSSGGSAAAVAANEAAYTLGTDTGGSVRQPASFCGVVGMRPTYGRVSRYGLFAFACSFDQAGVLSKTVRDNAMVLQAIAGADTHDATTLKAPVPDYIATLGMPIEHLRVGVPTEFLTPKNDDEVGQAALRALNILRHLGAQVVELFVSPSHLASQAYHVLTAAEAASNLARYDGVRYGNRSLHATDLQSLYCHSRGEGFGSEVKRRILFGNYLLGASGREEYYKKALQVREKIKQVFAESFFACDVILTPTSPVTAYRIDENDANLVQMYAQDCYTTPASLAGLPAISVPCGMSDAGLPIGIQLTAPAFCEELLYRVAYAFEQEYCHGYI